MKLQEIRSKLEEVYRVRGDIDVEVEEIKVKEQVTPACAKCGDKPQSIFSLLIK